MGANQTRTNNVRLGEWESSDDDMLFGATATSYTPTPRPPPALAQLTSPKSNTSNNGPSFNSKDPNSNNHSSSSVVVDLHGASGGISTISPTPTTNASDGNNTGTAKKMMAVFMDSYKKKKSNDSTSSPQSDNASGFGGGGGGGSGGGILGTARDKFGQFTGKAQDIKEEATYCADLTYTQRIQGFVVFFAAGFIFNILAWLSFTNLIRFGILFTVGNVLGAISTVFLVGPTRQLKKMFEGGRAYSTVIYLTSMVMTLVSAIVLESALLTLLFCVLQYIAFLWYCLSYIPGAQNAARKCTGWMLC